MTAAARGRRMPPGSEFPHGDAQMEEEMEEYGGSGRASYRGWGAGAWRSNAEPERGTEVRAPRGRGSAFADYPPSHTDAWRATSEEEVGAPRGRRGSAFEDYSPSVRGRATPEEEVRAPRGGSRGSSAFADYPPSGAGSWRDAPEHVGMEVGARRGKGRGVPTFPHPGSGRGFAPLRGVARQSYGSPPGSVLGPMDVTGSKVYRKVTIPQPKEVEPSDPTCICDRVVKLVWCHSCGFMDDSGRVRVKKRCEVHPRVS